MARWRAGVAVVLAAAIGWPLLEPFAELMADPAGWAAWRDFPRLLVLARTTMELAVCVLAIDLPLGTLLAVLLYRSDLPARAVLRQLVVVALFVPLPMLTSAWQAAAGGGGWLADALRDWFGPEDAGRPWASGLGMAVWVHAAAGLPWVVWLVGQGLCWVERGAEEDALLAAGPLTVLLRVSLPRASGAVLAAAAWVALLTANEITVTDMTQVRTFAEEVYTQFVLPDPGAGLAPDVSVARAAAVALPGVVLTVLAVGWAVARWQRAVPPLGSAPRPWPLLRLGVWRSVWLGLVLVAGAVFGAVPVGSLVWKLGLAGVPEAWSPTAAGRFLRMAARAHAALIAESLSAAFATGILAAGLALAACWVARDDGWVRVFLVTVVAAAWATPGPVVGAGLKAVIERLVGWEERFMSHGPVWQLLYNGPSLVPVVWACLLRFFPCAVALVWPAVRLVPAELADAARVDGALPLRQLRHVAWPQTSPAVGRATVAVAVLSLGELSASKLVATPGGETFAHEVFTRMHYGVANHLAALCLLLLVLTAAPAALLALFRRRA
jgi:iron(III) transport system permease protein